MHLSNANSIPHTDAHNLSFIANIAVNTSKLVIYCAYFYQDPTQWGHKQAVIVSITHYAVRIIEILDSSNDHLPTARPSYALFGLLHAAAALLRLHKMPTVRGYVSKEETLSSLQRGIAILRQMSLDQTQHLPARVADIMTQLLTSSKVFVHPQSPPDEPQPVPLRIRNRLAMSHVLDHVVWWREEFGESGPIYPIPLADIQSKAQVPSKYQNGGHGQSNGETVKANWLSSTARISSQLPNMGVDPYFFAAPETGPQDELFPDLWSIWPIDGWNIPGE
jgi:hypothetical protein